MPRPRTKNKIPRLRKSDLRTLFRGRIVRTMAPPTALQRRALHIMCDALADSRLVLKSALEDIGASFTTLAEERDALIGVALTQAEQEAREPEKAIERTLNELIAQHGEHLVTRAWAEMIGSGVEG